MQFGIMAPYQMAPIDDGEYAVAFARLIEELGFESLWVSEHAVMCVDLSSTYPYDPSGRPPFADDEVQPDPLLWLAYVASATRRLRLATGILILPQREPVVLAKMLATLDRLCGGRLLLGIGVGWNRDESEATGACFETRGARTDEYVHAMRALWRDPVSSYEGTYVRFRGVVSEPRPQRPGGVPIVVGGHSPAAARRAGRLGDGFYPLRVASGTTPGAWDDRTLGALRATMEESARAHGRDPSAIPITCAAIPSIELAKLYRDLGVSRVVLYPPAGDLEELRRQLEPFADACLAKPL